MRTADLMTKAGFEAYDGSGCVPDPVMSGLKADGGVCGKAGAQHNTPAHDPALVAKAVAFLQSRPQYGAIFVDDRHQIPGTLPMSRVHLENTGRNPDIVVSFNFDPQATVQGFPGTEYERAQGNRGMHGSFSPIDVHSTLVASGPDFRTAFAAPHPSGNVDLAPTVAQLFGLSLPQADGRPLIEAL